MLLDAYGKDQRNTTIQFKTDDDDDYGMPSSSSMEILGKTSPLLEKFANIILSKALRSPGNPVVVAAVLLMPLLLLMHNPKLALAASGGVMGGSSFSESYSSESSFSSFSESSSSSSYSSSGSYSFESDSSSESSPARLLQASLKKSYAVRKKSYPRRTSLDRYAVNSKTSYAALSSSLSEEEVYSLSSSVSQAQVGGSTGLTAVDWVILPALMLVMGILAFAFYNSTRDTVSTAEKKCRYSVATQRITILKLQVGLLGSGRSLQRDLDQIAETADTSIRKGLNYILTETISALFRHPDYWFAAYSSTDIKRSTYEGETKFNELSIEERSKLDEETLVNLNSMKKRSSKIERSTGFNNGYIVVTILVAADGEHELPTINGESDLKKALNKLGSIPSSRTLAVQVLWTPQKEDDVLSEQELLEKYFLLQPL